MLKVLRHLSDKIRLQTEKSRNLLASVVRNQDPLLRLYHPETRQSSLKECTDLDQLIYDEAQALLLKNLIKGRPVRLLGVGVTKLDKPHHQLSLWEPETDRKKELVKAVDELRERFGKDIIKRADSLDETKNHFD